MANITLKQRFAILIASILIAFIIIGVFTFYSFKRIQYYNSIADKVSDLQILTLDLRKNEKDFLSREIINADYFKTGKSKYLINFKNSIDSVKTILEFLHNTSFIHNSDADTLLEKAESGFVNYQQIFDMIVSHINERGFKDYGLEGEMRKNIHTVEESLLNLNNDKILSHLLMLRRHEKDFLLRKDLLYQEKFSIELADFYRTIDYSGMSASNKEYIKRNLLNYENAFNTLLEKEIEIGLNEQEGLLGQLRAEVREIEPRVAASHEIIMSETASHVNRSVLILILIITIGTMLSLAMVVFITRNVYKLIGGEPKLVADIAESISSGNLDIGLEKSENYTGLMKSMSLMAEKLESVLKGVLENTDMIVAASEQLSSSSQQISQGANEQASTVEEVSATIEQINANIQQNTDNAQQTDSIAVSAKNGIISVNEQSEKSLDANRKIADKIKIINDIAFQTNILALNAAVEAARAGEHGKGFAVVAAEVRKLAERSKLAADDIVSLTENSLLQAEEAGVKLAEMLPEIERTSQLIQEIAAASQEQSNGANQVTNAIQQLSSVTQENAAASEELASSARELESQAISMKETISYFKVNGNSQSKASKIPTNTFRNQEFKNTDPFAQMQKSTAKPVEIDLTDRDFERF